MLDYKESPYIIAFILFLVISFGSKIFQEQCNDKKDFTRTEMAVTVVLPGLVAGFIGYYFTNEYKIGKRGRFSLLQEPFDSPLAE
tara:strand:+ start:633 stop:887 length:255 start_codon:yes stop_codon:yes gene_type:complete